jgi:hypothetical protein
VLTDTLRSFFLFFSFFFCFDRLHSQAFDLLRRLRDAASAQPLLHHFLLACESSQQFDAVLHLPFEPSEEQYLEEYLVSSSSPLAQASLRMGRKAP